MIAQEFANSTDRTAVNLAAQRAADQTQRNLDAAQQTADLEWLRGFGACQFATCAYSALPNDDQRMGWRAAERAAGEAMYTADAWTQHGVTYAERSIQ